MRRSAFLSLCLLLSAMWASGCRKDSAPPPQSKTGAPPAKVATPESLPGGKTPTATAEEAEPKKEESKQSTRQVEKKAAAPRESPPRKKRPLVGYDFVTPPGATSWPMSPPVSDFEGVTSDKLASGWQEVSVENTLTSADHRAFTRSDWALDPVTLNNRGALVYELILRREFSRLDEEFMPSEYDLMLYVKQKGLVDAYDVVSALKKRLRPQYEKLAGEYGEFPEPLAREDTLDGLVTTGMVRVSKWRFRYKDKEGVEKKGCYMFVLLELVWRLVSLDCVDVPWNPTTAVPTEVPDGAVEGAKPPAAAAGAKMREGD